MTRKIDGNTPDAAAGRLLAHAEHLDAKAARCTYESNAHSKSVARATHLRSCAALIVSKTEHGQKMRDRLAEVHALALGWRGLAEWVTLVSGELFREARV